MKALVQLFLAFLPWALRRFVLVRIFGYDIHPTAYVGRSIVMAKRVKLGPHAAIGNLTMVRALEELELEESAILGDLNWVYGFPRENREFFAHQTERRSVLHVGAHSAITKRHIIDCTNEVRIGKFTTFAGYRSQILTHSIDLERSRQSSAPVEIGDYCFVGTDCVLLGGAVLPSYSVLGAKSLLNKAQSQERALYAGVPARLVKELPDDWDYFKREQGFVK